MQRIKSRIFLGGWGWGWGIEDATASKCVVHNKLNKILRKFGRVSERKFVLFDRILVM